MARLEICCIRSLLSAGLLAYAFDPPPLLVIGGVEFEGSWRRDEPFVIDVPPGPIYIEAFQVSTHPVSVFFRRRLPQRPAELRLDVPVDCVTMRLEFRAGRLAFDPGSVNVREVIES